MEISCHPLSLMIRCSRKNTVSNLDMVANFLVEHVVSFFILLVSGTAVLCTSCFNPEGLISCFAGDVQEVKLAKSKCQMNLSYLLTKARSEKDEKVINLYGL